jgi:hypothetical protein
VKWNEVQANEYSTNNTDINNELKMLDLQFRIGKMFTELSHEYDSIISTFRRARRDLLNSTSSQIDSTREDRFYAYLNQWKSFVYEAICRKTGEVKNHISYSADGRVISISHEVDGWKDIDILKGFCDYAEINYEPKFFAQYKKRIENISSLTVIVFIEISDFSPHLGVRVGCNISKPTDKRTLRQFLQDSCELENITSWYTTNQPVPILFGFSIGNLDHEFTVGFYFFDGPANFNLAKSVTAFQAYGAEISGPNFDVLKLVPCDELKIFMTSNMEGVQKVRLMMNKLSEETEKKLLEKFDKKYDGFTMKLFKNAFMEIAGKTNHMLEYSSNGFQVIVYHEIGDEINNNAYFETLS